MPRSHFVRARRPSLAAITGVLLFGLGAVAPASAQLGSWTPTPAPELGSVEKFKLNAASGVSATMLNGQKVQVGPYTASLASDPTKGTFSVYCVDFENGIKVGQTWWGNVSEIAAGGLENTRLGNAGDAVERYEKAVWLAQQFAVNQTKTAWTSIQDAIWAILTPGPASVAFRNGDIDTRGLRSEPGLGEITETKTKFWFWYKYEYSATYDWLAKADDAFAAGRPGGFTAEDWRVVTDVRADGKKYGVQEYIVQVPPNSTVPEPVSMVLLGTGLAGLGALRRWRRRGAEPN